MKDQKVNSTLASGIKIKVNIKITNKTTTEIGIMP